MINQDFIRITQIISQTNRFISENDDKLFVHQRDQMIDTCTLHLSKLQNDGISYCRLKNLVTNIVDQHISECAEWFIDVTMTTSSNLVLLNESDYTRRDIPISLINWTLSNNIEHTKNQG